MENESRTNIRVCVRFRPQNRLESERSGNRCINVDESKTRVAVVDSLNPPQEFSFDRIFPETSTQDEVYQYVARPLVAEVIAGYNCTIFAYGQTGSGKTHTMMGQAENRANHGVIPRIITEMFDVILQSPDTLEFTVKASYLELYLEKIHDLLNPAEMNLRVREDPAKGVYVEGMTEVYVGSAEEMIDLMHKGSTNRAVASTRMNEESSRSHSIFGIEVEKHDLSNGLKTIGKMYLVDLAGSEMVGKTQATGQTLQEAKIINKSLSALGNVIKSLTDGADHVPYRDSKLTRMLQDSLGGNAKTSLVITASSSSYNIVETISTLRFGTRAKRIKNRPKVNQERSIEEYRRLLEQSEQKEAEYMSTIKRLQHELSRLQPVAVTTTSAPTVCDEDLAEIRELLINGIRSCRIPIDHPPESENTLDNIRSLIQTQSRAYVKLKAEQEAQVDAIEEREIEAAELRELERTAQERLEEAAQKLQEALQAKEAQEARAVESEAQLKHKDYARRENRLVVAQLRDDLDILMRGAQYGMEMDLSSFEPRCQAALSRLAAAFSRDTPDASDDEDETSTQFSDVISVDEDTQLTPIASARKAKRRTRREMELESDVQVLTQKMVELRVELEAERENVSQLYEAIDNKSIDKEKITRKLAQEGIQLRLALDRKSQQHQQLALMFQNVEASNKKMQERINNREAQIQNLEHSLAEFQQTHRTTMEEMTDRLQLYESQLKALSSDETLRPRARLVKSIRGRSQMHLRSYDEDDAESSDTASKQTSPTTSTPPDAESAPGSEAEKLSSLARRIRQAQNVNDAKKAAKGSMSPVRASTSNGESLTQKPSRTMGAAYSSPTPAKGEMIRDFGTPESGRKSPPRVARITNSSTESPSPQPETETFVARAIRSISASRGGRRQETETPTGAKPDENSGGGILGTLRRRTSFRSANNSAPTEAVPSTPPTPDSEDAGILAAFRRRPSFTQSNGNS